jgi:hypothetical protein
VADTEVPAALAALLLAPSSSELQSIRTLLNTTATCKPCLMASQALMPIVDCHAGVATCMMARQAWVPGTGRAQLLASKAVELQRASQSHRADLLEPAVLQLLVKMSAVKKQRGITMHMPTATPV